MTSIGKPIRTVVYDPVQPPVPLEPAKIPERTPQGPDLEPVPAQAP